MRLSGGQTETGWMQETSVTESMNHGPQSPRVCSARVVLAAQAVGWFAVLTAQACAAEYTGLVDLTDHASVTCSRYTFDRQQGQMRCIARITNRGGEAVRVPLVLACKDLPAGVVLRADGALSDGTPFVDFSGKVQGGILAVGQTTEACTLAFTCQAQVRMAPTLAVWGQPALDVSGSASPASGPVPLQVSFGAASRGNVVKYEWDFTDDGIYEVQSPTSPGASAIYAATGSWTARIRVTDNAGYTATDAVLVTALPGFESRPAAAPLQGFAPLKVRFRSEGFDPSGTLESFWWDFDGDGTWDTQDVIAKDYTHTYPRSGTFHPALRVRSSTGKEATASLTIDVENSPPLARADVNPSNGEVPLTVQLSGSAEDPDGSVVLYEWDFDGDGTFDWSSATTGETTTAYRQEGTYRAVFRVTDDQGARTLAAATTTVVSVGPKGSPTVSAWASPCTGEAPLTVSLGGTASDPDHSIVLYEWDFDGDGVYDWSSSTTPETSTAYTRAGTHYAFLRVTDETGLIAVDAVTLLVDLNVNLWVEQNTIGLSQPDFLNDCQNAPCQVRASSSRSGNPATAAIDGQPETYWMSELGDNPSYSPTETFIEVCLPLAQTVSQVNLNGGIAWENQGILAGQLSLFDAADSLLYSQEVAMASSDVEVMLPEICDVRRCRLTVRSAAMADQCLLAEFEVGRSPGEPGQPFVNLSRFAGVVARASSTLDGAVCAPAQVIDGNLDTAWISGAWDGPGRHPPRRTGDTTFEVAFVQPRTVSQINIKGGSLWPSYGMTRGRLDLFDAGEVLLVSRDVTMACQDLQTSIPPTDGVCRCRLTVLEAHADYPPLCCLAEFEVGTQAAPPTDLSGTHIGTFISADTRVWITLQDIWGSSVRTLVSGEPRAGGVFTDYWDGLDDYGVVVPDGLYYAILGYEVDGDRRVLDLTEVTGGTRHDFPFGTGCDQRESFPSTFTPFENDLLRLSFRLCRAQEVTAFIGPENTGTDATRLRTLVNRRPFPAGLSAITWDGLDDQGRLAMAPNGDRLITGFWRYDLPDNAIFMTGGTPQIMNLRAEANTFSPLSERCDSQGRGEGIVLRFSLSEEARRVDVRVHDVATSDLIRTIRLRDLAAGEQAVWWDGKNGNGEYADIGDYRLGVVAVDLQGNESMLRYVLVRLDY
jgi:PKD repeat protein/flagellar hook assembly protein FlgD